MIFEINSDVPPRAQQGLERKLKELDREIKVVKKEARQMADQQRNNRAILFDMVALG
ncbi:MAG: hypothetical protein V3S33_08860 [Gammaproteobacteria bacterium]